MDFKLLFCKRLRAIIALSILTTSPVVFAQANNKSAQGGNKVTSAGYWIHDKVQEIPELKTGPFVRDVGR